MGSEPSPLVAEIKQALVSELKVRYAGKQSSRDKDKDKQSSKDKDKPKSTEAAPAQSSADVSSLEAMVAAQGNKVRELKAAKGDKDAINAAVAHLLDLKKQRCVAQGVDPATLAKPGKKKK